MWVEDVVCQKFHSAGRLGQLFAVSQPQSSQYIVDTEDQDIQHAMTVSLSQATSELALMEKQRQDRIEADQDRFQFNAWLDRAGWAKHLKGFDRSWLLTAVEKPKPTEKALKRVCWALQMVIYKAQQSSRPTVVGMAAMNYINRRELGSTTNEKPFNARQTGKTMVKYSGWWLEIVRYIWRTHALPQIKDNEKEGETQDKRPPYQLTSRQDMWLQKIQAIVGRDGDDDDWFEESDSDEPLEAEEEDVLEELVLKFVLQLADHAIADNEYSSALISAMAVLGIDANCGWVTPLTYTPKQAAVVNITRMLVLYQSTQMRKSEVAKLEAEGWGRKDAEDMAPSHFYFVKNMANRFMTLTNYSGEPTPIDAIQRLKAYGMKIRFSTSAEGVIDWVDDTLLYGNIRFSMPQLRSMIHGTVASVRQRLMNELMLLQVDDEGGIVPGTTKLPVIHWDRLVDNPAEQKTGWSFRDDVRNLDAVDVKTPSTWLEQRITDEAQLRKAFVDVAASREAIAVGKPPVWSRDRVREYQKSMNAFRHGLIVLVHMTGGLPARASELVTIQYKNSANGESRGLFIEDGLVVYVTMYHKNIGTTGSAKVIHRYLPREVGELVVYYLWFALPFAEKLERIVSEEEVESSAYIWVPELEKAWTMPQRKKRAMNGRPQSSVDREEEEREEGQEEEEADEPEETASVYGQPVVLWNTNRVRNAVQRISLEYMGIKVTILGWRHSTKAIYRRYVDSRTAVQTFMQADEEQDNRQEDDDAADLQQGHSSQVGGMIYGRAITESMFSSESKRAAFRRVSREWHAFLQIPSVLEAQPKRGLRTVVARQGALDEEYRRWKMLRWVDVDAELKKVAGSQSTFRSVQKPALQAIMQQKSPIVAIMGTGAGKSVLFMLPASVSSGVTVVVVPLVSLRSNMKARCDKLGITCVEWSSRRPHEWAQVVLVTPESAVGEAFGQFMNRQRAMGRLDRIVVDECHVIMDSLQGWRGRMLALRELFRVETQMVYLTATLRPSEEAPFRQLMGLPAREQCQWFRGVTTRPNIRYQVKAYDVEREDEAVSELVEGLKEKHPEGQIIVYCSSVERTVRLADVLTCVCYHRNVGSSQEKHRLVEQLTDGLQQVFTATNALGLGVDAPTIRAVVHVGTVRMVRHYAQESGRAGRDGKPSEAIIMQGFRKSRRGRTPTRFPKDVEAEMVELIGGEGCMREVLDKAMDGREDREGCEEGEERCQRCSEAGSIERLHALGEVGSAEAEVVEDEAGENGENTDMAPPMLGQEEVGRYEFEQQLSARRMQAVKIASQQAQEAMEVGRLVEIMDEWKTGCQRCRAWGTWAEEHEIESCQREGAEEIRQGIEAFERTKQWAAYSCCYECGMPQAICESFGLDIVHGGHRKQRETRCQYKGVLVKTVMAVWVQQTQAFGDLVEAAMKKDGWVEQTAEDFETGPGMEAVGRWFCEKKRWGEIESNKMCWFLNQLLGR